MIFFTSQFYYLFLVMLKVVAVLLLGVIAANAFKFGGGKRIRFGKGFGGSSGGIGGYGRKSYGGSGNLPCFNYLSRQSFFNALQT